MIPLLQVEIIEKMLSGRYPMFVTTNGYIKSITNRSVFHVIADDIGLGPSDSPLYNAKQENIDIGDARSNFFFTNRVALRRFKMLCKAQENDLIEALMPTRASTPEQALLLRIRLLDKYTNTIGKV